MRGKGGCFKTRSLAWELSSAEFSQDFFVSAQDTQPTSVFFKPDGLKMYVFGKTNATVYEYDLSSAWDISTASYLQSFAISTANTAPESITFKPDGFAFYVIGNSTDLVLQYSLGTAWDVTTAALSQSIDITSPSIINTRALFLGANGEKMYVVEFGPAFADVLEYNLGTAWSVSTASYSQSFLLNAQETSPTSIFFKPDGLRMYISGSVGDDVNEYRLSSAWDISTAIYKQTFKDPAKASGEGIFFDSQGFKLFQVDSFAKKINEFRIAEF